MQAQFEKKTFFKNILFFKSFYVRVFHRQSDQEDKTQRFRSHQNHCNTFHFAMLLYFYMGPHRLSLSWAKFHKILSANMQWSPLSTRSFVVKRVLLRLFHSCACVCMLLLSSTVNNLSLGESHQNELIGVEILNFT